MVLFFLYTSSLKSGVYIILLVHLYWDELRSHACLVAAVLVGSCGPEADEIMRLLC